MKYPWVASAMWFAIVAPMLVAAQEPTDVRAKLVQQLRDLQRERRWQDVVDRTQAVDFNTWPTEQAADALHLRGQAYTFLKQGRVAERDLKMAVKLAPRHELYWFTLADLYANHLRDDAQALATYEQVWTLTGKSNGWLPLSVTIGRARILTDQVKADEALAILNQYDDLSTLPTVWRVKILRAYGHAYAAKGDEAASLAKFREALSLEQP